MALGTQREIAVYITEFRDTGIVVPCQSLWNIFLPVKKPGTSDSPESDSSRETGVHCDLKDAFLSLSLAERLSGKQVIKGH